MLIKSFEINFFINSQSELIKKLISKLFIRISHLIYNYIYKMKLTVRNLKQQSEDFDDLELTMTVTEFADKVKMRYNFPEDVRLIYCGKILDQSKLLSDYFKETNTGFVVCMPQKKQQQDVIPVTQVAATVLPTVAPTVAPTVTPTVTSTLTPAVAVTNTQNAKYDIRQIRALLLVFMRLIKTNPILNFLHITTEEGIQNVLLDANFTSPTGPLQNILNQSSSIADAIDARQDFPIEIPGFDILPMNVPGLGLGLPTMPTSTNTTSTGPVQTTDPDNMFALPVTTGTNNGTTLTEEDKTNIQELIQLGFTQQEATIAYVNAGKDKNLAASLLFELS